MIPGKKKKKKFEKSQNNSDSTPFIILLFFFFFFFCTRIINRCNCNSPVRAKIQIYASINIFIFDLQRGPINRLQIRSAGAVLSFYRKYKTGGGRGS